LLLLRTMQYTAAMIYWNADLAEKISCSPEEIQTIPDYVKQLIEIAKQIVQSGNQIQASELAPDDEFCAMAFH